MASDGDVRSVGEFRRFALAVCLIGVLVQLGLTAYYLGMGHRATPRDVPVGVIAPAERREPAVRLLERDGTFRVTEFTSVFALTAAIERRDVYGGVDIGGGTPHLYLAGAAGPAAANLLRTSFTTVVQQQQAARVEQLAAAGGSVPAVQVQALNAVPPVTDVVPLPADDTNGVSLGFLIQALCLGGTIASMGLGRLIPRTRRSFKRGVGHLATLLVYAAGSAAAVLWSMGWFGVGGGADHLELFGVLALVSLAVTGSTAAAVALLGPVGALLGALYFTVGTVISGAAILPEFLPGFGRVAGANLPTGAGVQAVRDNLYFPQAPIGEHLLVLGLYAGIGCLIVLITNLLPNRGDKTSEVELDLVERLEGAEHREPVPVTITA